MRTARRSRNLPVQLLPRWSQMGQRPVLCSAPRSAFHGGGELSTIPHLNLAYSGSQSQAYYSLKLCFIPIFRWFGIPLIGLDLAKGGHSRNQQAEKAGLGGAGKKTQMSKNQKIRAGAGLARLPMESCGRCWFPACCQASGLRFGRMSGSLPAALCSSQ